MLGTLRRDGSPRISPVETWFADGELVLGVMRASGKARDLRRDPRVALQSLVTSPDSGEPELKLYGRVAPKEARVGWWAEEYRDRADVYAFAVEEALYVEWLVETQLMRVRRWSDAGGETVRERPYP